MKPIDNIKPLLGMVGILVLFFIAFNLIAYVGLEKATSISKPNQVTLMVLKETELSFNAFNNLERDYHKCIVLRDVAYTKEFNEQVNAFYKHLALVENAGITDATELAHIATFKKLVSSEVENCKNILQALNANGPKASNALLANDNEQRLEEIGATVNLIEDAERANLANFDSERLLNARRTFVFIFLNAVFALLVFVMLGRRVQKNIDQKLAAEAELSKLNAELETRVAQRTADLQFSEQNLKHAELVAGAGHWHLNLADHLMYLSEGSRKIYGYKQEYVSNEVIKAHRVPAYNQRMDDMVKAIIANPGRSYNAEYQVKHAETGQIVDVYITAEYNAATNTVFGVVFDITARKKAEADIINEKLLSDTLIDNLPGMCYVFNREGKFLRWNKNAETITGYTAGELINMQPLQFYLPADHKYITNEIEKVFEKGCGVIEAEMLTKNKDTIPYRFYGTRMTYDNEVCLLGMAFDITDSKNAAAEILAEKQLSDALIDNLPGIFYVFNTDRQILRWNKHAETITGYSSEEITELNTLDFFDEKDWDKVAESTIEVLTEGQSTIEIDLLTKAGDKKAYQFSGTRITYNGQLCIMGIGINISERKQAEQELIKSEEKYRLMFYNSPMPMFITSLPEYDYIDVNDAALLHYGYTREEFLKMNARDIRPAEDLARFENEVVNVSRPGSNNIGKWRHLKKNGETIWVQLYTHEHTVNGKMQRVVMINDITLVEQAMNKLRDKVKELSDYKVAIDEAAIVAITDANGIIQYVNDNFERISKYSRNELVGHDHSIVNSGYHSKEFIKTLWDTITRGRVWSGEIRNRAKDGSLYWVNTTIIPFLNEHKKPVQHLSIRFDITQRKDAEERLITSELKLREAQTVAHIGSFEMDLATGSVEWSDEIYNLYGYVRGELESGFETFFNLMHPDDVAHVKSVVDSIGENEGQTMSANYRFIRKNGEVRYGYSEAKLELDTAKKPVRLYGIMQDVTEIKKAEEEIRSLNQNLENRIAERTAELVAANQALEAFSYMVSHDLKSPLRGINGFATMLERNYTAHMPEDGVKMLQHIVQNSKRMSQLIEDLLALARFEREPVRVVRVDMKSLFDRVWKNISLASPNKAHFSLANLPAIDGDTSMLEQVVVNLLSNAAKYSSKKESPEVTVGFERLGNEITFYVKDNGAGFDMVNYDRLFGAFQRLHAMADFEGTGVGLALVKRIIDKHKGSIWAEGKPGEGATFYFKLPIHQLA